MEKRSIKARDKSARLQYKERVKIETLIGESWSNGKIAILLGRNKSTITREINQNKGGPRRENYSADFAHKESEFRKYYAARMNPSKDPRIWVYVEEMLKEGWTPELISGRISNDHPGWSVSYESIYQHVYNSNRGLAGYLPSRRQFRRPKGPRRAKKSKIPNRLSILERPQKINNRSEVGHWESDSIVSRKSKAGLNVMVERSTRYVQITKIPNLTSIQTQKAITSRLASWDSSLRKSITYDNGSENHNHELINKELNTKSYFCEPYHSWEKGAVEQVNMLIRRYVPKGSDLSLLTDEHVQYIENQLNNRPKKCLDYKTPYEVFNNYH
jgi:transposase, IS30 family